MELMFSWGLRAGNCGQVSKYMNYDKRYDKKETVHKVVNMGGGQGNFSDLWGRAIFEPSPQG